MFIGGLNIRKNSVEEFCELVEKSGGGPRSAVFDGDSLKLQGRFLSLGFTLISLV